jgi:hypothetical protein
MRCASRASAYHRGPYTRQGPLWRDALPAVWAGERACSNVEIPPALTCCRA